MKQELGSKEKTIQLLDLKVKNHREIESLYEMQKSDIHQAFNRNVDISTQVQELQKEVEG